MMAFQEVLGASSSSIGVRNRVRIGSFLLAALVCALYIGVRPGAIADASTVLPLAGAQLSPTIVDSGIVFQNGPNVDGPFELKMMEWQGTVRTLESGTDWRIGPAGWSGLVAYVVRPADPAISADHVVVRDIASGHSWLLTATDSRKADVTVHGESVLWAEYTAGTWEIMHYDLSVDSDSDGVPNYRDTPRPDPDPALTLFAGGPGNQRYPAAGARGIVWADDGSVRFLSAAGGGVQTLDADTGVASAPDISGDLIVWSSMRGEFRDIAVKDLRTDEVTWLGSPAHHDARPTTDGATVAWVRGTGATQRIYKSEGLGPGALVSDSGFRQVDPVCRDGVLAWVDEIGGALTPDLAIVDLSGGPDIVFPDPVKSPPVINIAGSTRIATAIQASQAAFDAGSVGTVVIATGYNWPDALGGTALAGAVNGPILLVEPHTLPGVVTSEITRLGASRAIILGGTSAVGPAVEDALRSLLGRGSVERIAGHDRYATADRVALRVIKERGAGYDGTAFVATGGGFPDALAAAPLAAAKGWPLFLADPARGLTSGTRSAMAAVDDVHILGGTAVVPSSTENTIKSLGKRTQRLSGGDRYATAVAVADHAVRTAGHGWDRVGITTGTDFPDALAGGVLQGKAGSVMLLTAPDRLDAHTARALEINKARISTVTYFGGTSAVSTAVRTRVNGIVK